MLLAQKIWIAQVDPSSCRITFICPMRFNSFPMDVQVCTFQVSRTKENVTKWKTGCHHSGKSMPGNSGSSTREFVLSNYSETVDLIYNISTGNPHEILKQILQSSLFGNILDLNILAFKEEDSKNDEWHQIK